MSILSLLNLADLPSLQSPKVQEEEGGAVHFTEQTWPDRLWRAVIPGYASQQDRRIGETVLRFLQDVVTAKRVESMETVRWVIQQTPTVSLEEPLLGNIRRYLIAWNLQNGHEKQAALLKQEHLTSPGNESLHKWRKLNYAEESFWRCPDLVDMVFQSRLHHHISHKDYARLGHTIRFENGNALLMQQGVYTPWSTIRSQLHWDSEKQSFFSTDAQGVTQEWDYLQQGFVPCTRTIGTTLHPFKTLAKPPKDSQIYLATSHVAPAKSSPLIHPLVGTARHVFIRFVIGNDFGHHEELKPGQVFTMGWGGTFWEGDGFVIQELVKSFRGRWLQPDWTHFTAHNIALTPLMTGTAEQRKEKILTLITTIREQNEKRDPFNTQSNNCAKKTCELLQRLELLPQDLDYKQYVGMIWLQMLIPQRIQKMLAQYKETLEETLPAWLLTALKAAGAVMLRLYLFVHSLLLTPFYCMLGALNSSPEVQPLFANIWDMLNPEKMSFGSTSKVYAWQRSRPLSAAEVQDRELRTSLCLLPRSRSQESILSLAEVANQLFIPA